jgi:hypothetical protein
VHVQVRDSTGYRRQYGHASDGGSPDPLVGPRSCRAPNEKIRGQHAGVGDWFNTPLGHMGFKSLGTQPWARIQPPQQEHPLAGPRCQSGHLRWIRMGHQVTVAIVTSDLGVLVGRRADVSPPWTFPAGKLQRVGHPSKPPSAGRAPSGAVGDACSQEWRRRGHGSARQAR